MSLAKSSDCDKAHFVIGKRIGRRLMRLRELWGIEIMNDDGIRQQLQMLKVEHRDLDDSIAALQEQPIADQLQVARLKRKKLALKDRIRLLEDQLVPDIIA
jgi:hypothetical protein